MNNGAPQFLIINNSSTDVMVCVSDVFFRMHGCRKLHIGVGRNGRLLAVFEVTLFRGEMSCGRIYGTCPTIVDEAVQAYVNTSIRERESARWAMAQ